MSLKMRVRALIMAGLLLITYHGSRADEVDLQWCSLLGGSGRDMARSIAVDGSGNTYITGLSESFDFPTTTGAFDTSRAGGFDVFIAKINSSGSALVYSTLLGGLAFDEGICAVVDPAGHAYLTGPTKSFDFPITLQALDTSYNGDFDVFVVKLCPTGDSLDYSTFLGGTSEDGAYAIEIDDSGCIYIAGETFSSDFPTVPWAFDTSHNGGRDAFAAKIKPSSDTLQYATFLGGTAEEGGYALAVDDLGCAYLSGSTGSADFPFTSEAFDTTHNGWDDAYVVKLTPSGGDLEYATFLGGRDYDQGYQIVLDHDGEIYLTGWTWSSNFPTTPDAYDSSYNDSEDAFLAKLDPSGTDLVYATFLGGQSYDLGLGIALDNLGAAHITGYTKSSDFP
ncbi:SBBP repeat-containing protein, partial [Candidatus Zixiibacteriota bacterium]